MIVSTNDGGGKGSKASFVLNQRNEGNRFGMEATAADWTRAAAALAHFSTPTIHPRHSAHAVRDFPCTLHC